MMPDLATWLARKPKGRAPKKPLPKRTKKRAAEERLYCRLAKKHLEDRPICEVWLKEHAPDYYGQPLTAKAVQYFINHANAPRSTQVHHAAKRYKSMLCNTKFFLAVCAANHARIEQNLGWARKEGFSLNF